MDPGILGRSEKFSIKATGFSDVQRCLVESREGVDFQSKF